MYILLSGICRKVFCSSSVGISCKIRNRVTLIRNLYTVDFVVTAYFCIVNVE
ncbi:hypothetical protein BFAG_04244 [Bacteroides fragilis 3_1_12]|uniref:Uncharacterized protein n=1 Tax=Bacteroides fragilis 3_1_12 TaxID=457424 RepID=A0ABN0BRK4_BACFG|nr:hypothetical protein BFAG_04244 [Bacteroides fragilis 3_1_12]